MRSARKDALCRRAACGAAAAAAAAILAVLAVGPVRAAVFPDLYSLMVTPEPGSPDMRAAAIDLAMRRLLTRVTGVRDPGADPELAGLIADAQSYVSFDGMVDRGRFRVEFYSTQIERVLESLGKPVWGQERPLTLLWVAIDAGGGERVLLSDAGIAGDTIADTAGVVGVSPETVELAQAVRSEIEAVAEERGLPIRFPLLDLEDLTTVTSADIWVPFVEQVEAASARYGADSILIGRISANPFGDSVRWTLVQGNEQSTYGGVEVAEGLHWAADRYVQAYSFVGGARTVRLVVRDVSTLDDYGRVLSYLESLSALQTIDVEGYDDDGRLLSLRASARGDLAVLEQMLGLGRVLRLDGPSSAADNTLVLTLVGGSRR